MNEQLVSFSNDQKDVIKKTLMPKGASDAETALFLQYCIRTQLDPFARQIYASKIGDKLSILASIDGFRLIAERSQKYAGQTIPQFMNKNGEWSEVWTSEKEYPVACKVGVLRKDFNEPLYAIAKWTSYAPYSNGKLGFMWSKMPEVMLAKVAEALALRKAFPNDLSGVYSADEMEQATDASKKATQIQPDVKTENKPTLLTDEQFNAELQKVAGIEDKDQLATQLSKIDNLKIITDEQKEILKKAHQARIEELTPKA